MRRSQARRKKVSQFGQYHGSSEAIYDGYQRRSQYLTLEDGTRLAYDLLLPTKDGAPAGGPLPALFKYTPYLRAFTIFDRDGNLLLDDLYELKWYERAALRLRTMISEQGHLMDAVANTGWLKNMLYHGYAVIVVERPGTVASANDGFLHAEAPTAAVVHDAYTIDYSTTSGRHSRRVPSWQPANTRTCATATKRP